jgi:signal transduction histidine kinase
VKFTPKGGKITIDARENEGKLIVEVRDTGVGLTQDELEKVFEPYYHKEKKSNNFSGLGLGLSLCKKFIELHGGEIWAASTPGKGSSFSFSLPVLHK